MTGATSRLRRCLALLRSPGHVARRLVEEMHRLRYQREVAAIFATAPLIAGAEPFTVLSMVQKKDLPSYLVAIKSFALRLNPRQVVIVCDPSMDAAQRALLLRHIPHAELCEARQYRHPGIPAGGCWERLNAICQYARHGYVMQLDADTVTTGMPVEVAASIRASRGFVMAGEAGQRFMSLADTAALSKRTYPDNPHIQCILEIALPEADLPAQARYVRGCAAFTGFPQSAQMQDALLRFSAAMRNRVGARWSDWGTEQAASNYLVANADDSLLLPFPEYGTPDVMNEQSRLVHFIGEMRFQSGKYRLATLRAIAAMRASTPLQD